LPCGRLNGRKAALIPARTLSVFVRDPEEGRLHEQSFSLRTRKSKSILRSARQSATTKLKGLLGSLREDILNRLFPAEN